MKTACGFATSNINRARVCRGALSSSTNLRLRPSLLTNRYLSTAFIRRIGFLCSPPNSMVSIQSDACPRFLPESPTTRSTGSRNCCRGIGQPLTAPLKPPSLDRQIICPPISKWTDNLSATTGSEDVLLLPIHFRLLSKPSLPSSRSFGTNDRKRAVPHCLAKLQRGARTLPRLLFRAKVMVPKRP